jgi:glutamate/aspartate transport system substrate-binding protein
MMRQLLMGMIALWFAISAQAQVQPSTDAGTLAKIRELGAIFVGHRENSAPFSYSPDGAPIGYTIEICDRVVDEVRKQLALPNLKVIPVPLPGNLRFTMLIDGIVDMECGVSTNTKIRQQRMAFSVSFFEATTKFLVTKDSPLSRIQDLDGKTVVVGAATTAGRSVGTVAKRRNLTIRQISARDRSVALEMLANGKADAYLSDDALVLGALLNSKYQDKFRLLDESVSVEPYGIALRRDDPEFKKLVDDVMIGMMKSGEMAKLYQKWFMEPIPPSGQSLAMPLDDRNKELFANPNDRGV